MKLDYYKHRTKYKHILIYIQFSDSKHDEAQRRQTLGHQLLDVALPTPAGQMKMMTAVDVVK